MSWGTGRAAPSGLIGGVEQTSAAANPGPREGELDARRRLVVAGDLGHQGLDLLVPLMATKVSAPP